MLDETFQRNGFKFVILLEFEFHISFRATRAFIKEKKSVQCEMKKKNYEYSYFKIMTIYEVFSPGTFHEE